MRTFLGIDVGSISTNLVLIDDDQTVLASLYVRGDGDPIRSVQRCLWQLQQEMPAQAVICGVGATGSGRELIGAVVGADVVRNEISAHARAAVGLVPDVRTVIEIGGQDSKVTILEDGTVVDFAMNLVCAAGTGSFLDSQARRLNMDITELGKRAMRSRHPTAIAGRCTVFAESDMIHKQQMGHAQEDILMGLCQALVRNFIGNVARGKDLQPPLLLQGGVSANPGIRRAFEEILDFEIIIPAHHMVMGALGAALLAQDADPQSTLFGGMTLSRQQITTKVVICPDCANECEIIEVYRDGERTGCTGGRCGKW